MCLYEYEEDRLWENSAPLRFRTLFSLREVKHTEDLKGLPEGAYSLTFGLFK